MKNLCPVFLFALSNSVQNARLGDSGDPGFEPRSGKVELRARKVKGQRSN